MGDSSRPPTVPEKYFPPYKREEKVDSVKESPNRPVPPHQLNSFTNPVSHPGVYDAGVSYPTGGSEAYSLEVLGETKWGTHHSSHIFLEIKPQ